MRGSTRQPIFVDAYGVASFGAEVLGVSANRKDDVSDPALVNVRVTAVVLSVDYRHARVHFALTAGSEQRSVVERALGRVTPFLRARLADAIDMKRTPDLRFVFDSVVPNDGGAPCSG